MQSKNVPVVKDDKTNGLVLGMWRLVKEPFRNSRVYRVETSWFVQTCFYIRVHTNTHTHTHTQSACDPSNCIYLFDLST
jgi:hypothetical protein